MEWFNILMARLRALFQRESILQGFWCKFSKAGRLSLFQLLLMRQSPLPIPA